MSKRPVIRQPSAMRTRDFKRVTSDTPVKEKTPAEIIDEKMAAMAADPEAIPVYWTENGPDAKVGTLSFQSTRF